MGNWLGDWQGDWLGSGEPAPAGALSGTAAIAISVAGTLSATAHVFGQSSIALYAIGECTDTLPIHPTEPTASGGGAWASVDRILKNRRKRDEEALLMLGAL